MKKLILVKFFFTIGLSLIFQQNNWAYDINEWIYDNQDTSSYNYNRMIVEMFVANDFDTISICDNDLAIDTFEQRIDILKSYSSKKNENIFGNIHYFVINFVLLTGIDTELGGNYIGYYNPTNADLEKRIKWFQERKDYLCWCKEKNILFSRKKE